MATSMPQPGGPQQDPQQGQGGPSGGDSSSSQMNQAQQIFASKAMEARKIGSQMTVIQPEMQQISQLWVQALQKISQAAPGPPQQPQSSGAQ
jgi:hypothetical protein